MHLSQNVVETFIDRIEVFNDERVKIHFIFEDVLADHAEWAVGKTNAATRVFLVRTRDSWYHKSKEKSVHGYAKGAAEMKKLNIPVGISDFEKIRNGGFYYIDKSGLITEILDEKAEVTLITRPRRFGKTLGM